MKHVAEKTALLVLLLALGACQSPQTINGRKVIGTHWKDGHIVFILEPNEEDKAALQQALKEAESAARDVTFTPAAQ
jgi:hypothetical protein